MLGAAARFLVTAVDVRSKSSALAAACPLSSSCRFDVKGWGLGMAPIKKKACLDMIDANPQCTFVVGLAWCKWAQEGVAEHPMFKWREDILSR